MTVINVEIRLLWPVVFTSVRDQQAVISGCWWWMELAVAMCLFLSPHKHPPVSSPSTPHANSLSLYALTSHVTTSRDVITWRDITWWHLAITCHHVTWSRDDIIWDDHTMTSFDMITRWHHVTWWMNRHDGICRRDISCDWRNLVNECVKTLCKELSVLFLDLRHDESKWQL